jgi:uncharacterized PurR-regulated membrane protein YhhQ (DUF165 family)
MIAPLLTYASLIGLANWMTDTLGLVPIGFGLTVTAGTFAAGLVLVSRDWVQRSLGPYWAIAAIGMGTILSLLLSTPALAVASAIAFLFAEMVDMAVYTPIARKRLAAAVLASSVVSAPVDTVLFLHLAGFPVTWQAVLGQFIVKTMMALIVAIIIAWRPNVLPVGKQGASDLGSDAQR